MYNCIRATFESCDCKAHFKLFSYWLLNYVENICGNARDEEQLCWTFFLQHSRHYPPAMTLAFSQTDSTLPQVHCNFSPPPPPHHHPMHTHQSKALPEYEHFKISNAHVKTEYLLLTVCTVKISFNVENTQAHTQTHTHTPQVHLPPNLSIMPLCFFIFFLWRCWAVISKTTARMAALIENNEGHIEHMVGVVSPPPPPLSFLLLSLCPCLHKTKGSL